MMTRFLTVAGLAAVVAGCSVFGIRSGYEQPDYEVVEQIGEDMEVRRYAPRVAVETTAAGEDRDEARSAAFRRLFDYISGENVGNREVAMTAPVESAPEGTDIAMTAPVETSADPTGTVRMRFFLPASFSRETAPAPLDPAVRLSTVPETTLAVRRFTGRWDEETLAAQSDSLLQAIDGSGWHLAGEPIVMFYDPPFTLPWLRRNEVAVPVDAS
jgi:hypothetical protein